MVGSEELQIYLCGLIGNLFEHPAHIVNDQHVINKVSGPGECISPPPEA